MNLNMFEDVKKLNNIPMIDVTQLTDMSKIFASVGLTLPIEKNNKGKNENIDEDFAILYSDDLKFKNRLKRYLNEKFNMGN